MSSPSTIVLPAPAVGWRRAAPALALALIAFALIALAALIAGLPVTAAVLLIGGAALALALLRWPLLALYLLVPAIPFGSLKPLPLAGANLTAADGLLLLTLALWLARGIVERRIMLRPASLLLPFIVFLLAVGLSVTGALSLQASAKELTKWIEMLASYWLLVQWSGANVGGSPAEGEAHRTAAFHAAIPLLSVMLLAGLAEALVGFYQYFLRVGPEGFILVGGALRAYGTFEQPNPYAGYLGLLIPLAFGVMLALPTLGRELGKRQNLALALLACVSFGAMLAALFFSLSRGALLGVAAALAAVLVIRSRRAAVAALAVAVVVALVALLGELNIIPDFIGERFAGVGDYFGLQDVRGVKTTDANFAIVERMAHWQAGLDMFQTHPWLGVGIGNYAAVYPLYSLPHWDDPLGHAHNYYINLLAESGLIGFGGYLVLWGAIFWFAWRAVRQTRGAAQAVAAGAVGVLVALSVHNLFDNLFVHSMQMQVGLTLGLVEGLVMRSRAVKQGGFS